MLRMQVVTPEGKLCLQGKELRKASEFLRKQAQKPSADESPSFPPDVAQPAKELKGVEKEAKRLLVKIERGKEE